MKKFLLGIALVLPVAVYLFLQAFGRNEYTLPIMFQDAVPEEIEQFCGTVALPYAIRLDLYNVKAHMPVVFDLRRSTDNNSFINNELKRVSQYFNNQGFHHIVVADLEEGIEGVVDQLIVEDLEGFSKCDLLYTQNNSFMVLVDTEGRIRGQYTSDKKQEFDRLIVEIEILQKFK